MNIYPIFFLEDFKGTLTSLRQLVDQGERSIFQIKIHQLTSQWREKWPMSLDQGSESLYTLAYFAWLKSKKLLPVPEQILQPEEDILDISETALADYSLFKKAAKQFTLLHEDQKKFFIRGGPAPENKQSPSFETIPLDLLTGLIQELIKRAEPHSLSVKEEPWTILEKSEAIIEALNNCSPLSFNLIFSPEKSRMELIITFLALLELIKNGQILIIEENLTKNWMIIKK
jgi:segregation and condensation protein A